VTASRFLRSTLEETALLERKPRTGLRDAHSDLAADSESWEQTFHENGTLLPHPEATPLDDPGIAEGAIGVLPSVTWASTIRFLPDPGLQILVRGLLRIPSVAECPSLRSLRERSASRPVSRTTGDPGCRDSRESVFSSSQGKGSFGCARLRRSCSR
jgi:hypothetical protein